MMFFNCKCHKSLYDFGKRAPSINDEHRCGPSKTIGSVLYLLLEEVIYRQNQTILMPFICSVLKLKGSSKEYVQIKIHQTHLIKPEFIAIIGNVKR